MNIPLAMIARRRAELEGLSSYKLARDFGVSQGMMYGILSGSQYVVPGAAIPQLGAQWHWLLEYQRLKSEGERPEVAAAVAAITGIKRVSPPSITGTNRRERPRWPTQEHADLAKARSLLYQARQWLKRK